MEMIRYVRFCMIPIVIGIIAFLIITWDGWSDDNGDDYKHDI